LDRDHRGLHGDEAHRRAVLAPKVCPTGKAQGRSGAEDGKDPAILIRDGKRPLSLAAPENSRILAIARTAWLWADRPLKKAVAAL
jgi:hypothetical protein